MEIKLLIEKMGRLKSEFFLRYLKVDQIKDYLMRLSDRDRKIVIVSAISLAVFILLGTYSGISHYLSKKEEKIEKEIANFDKIIGLRNEYLSSFAILKKIETTIKRTPFDFSLATHLENLAQNNGIKIDSMKPKAATPNKFYKETQVEVKIRGVLLKTLVNFLYEVENSKEFLKITSIQIRPSYAKPMYLDVTFSVSTFSPV